MQTKSNIFTSFLAPFALYTGVLVGLYLLESAWASILGYHVAICLVLTVTRGWRTGTDLIRGWHPRFGAAAILVCLIAGPAVYMLWSFIRLDGIDLGAHLRGLGLEGLSWWIFIAYYSLVNPWLEELFWRKWYPEKLKEPIVADLLFAGYHVFVLVLFIQLFWALAAYLVLFSTAWIWRGLARRYGGLAIPVASHMTADISLIISAAILASSSG